MAAMRALAPARSAAPSRRLAAAPPSDPPSLALVAADEEALERAERHDALGEHSTARCPPTVRRVVPTGRLAALKATIAQGGPVAVSRCPDLWGNRRCFLEMGAVQRGRAHELEPKWLQP
mmetsp:Transcript_83325/g.178615  ORF Transcript_83325/g.178615 Transcript_83325/m.178615 type:complete len:120 (+) Transcript_83325:669-1028(+)